MSEKIKTAAMPPFSRGRPRNKPGTGAAFITTAIFAITLAVFSGCASTGGAPGRGPSASTARADTSYAFGMWMGMSLREEGILYPFDYAELLRGIRDIVEGREHRLETETAAALMQAASLESRARLAEENRRAGEIFLAENIKRAEVSVTASGLQYETLKQGNGPRPSASDTVRLNYELSLVDGAVLGSTFADGSTAADSTTVDGRPVEIPIAQVIPGFAEGIQLMPVGSTFRLYMPPSLAYGEEGSAGVPPGATLVFRIELLSIVRQ